MTEARRQTRGTRLVQSALQTDNASGNLGLIFAAFLLIFLFSLEPNYLYSFRDLPVDMMSFLMPQVMNLKIVPLRNRM